MDGKKDNNRNIVKTVSTKSNSQNGQHLQSQNGEQLSKARRYWRLFYTNISVEPLLFLYGLGFSISQSISPVLYMDKICLVGSPLFGNASQTWDKEICDHMDTGQYPHVQTYVQTTYQKMTYAVLFIKGVPPIIFTLFIGPWSDRFGRKLLMVVPLTGYIGYNVWFLINVIWFDQMYPEWLMIEMFTFWPGGFFCLFLGAYSYAADRSSTKTRTLRIAVIDFVFFTGLAIGTGVAGRVNEYGGFKAIYSIGLVCQFLAFIYGILAIKENKKTLEFDDKLVQCVEDGTNRNHSVSGKQKPRAMTFRSVFSLEHIKNSFGVVFKPREDGSRHFIVLLVASFAIYTYANTGTILINLPYAKQQFIWAGDIQFNNWWAIYFSVTQICQAVGIGAVMPIFTQFLKMNDLVITTVCVISFILGLITTSLAHNAHVLYVAAGLQVFASLATTSIRAALSKIVHRKDIGKIFASVGCTQALIGELNPTYNLMFEKTLKWFPQFCYVFSCVLLLVMVAILAYCIWFWKKLMALQEKERLATTAAAAPPVVEEISSVPDESGAVKKDEADGGGGSDSDSYDEFDATMFKFARRVRHASIWSASEMSIKL